MNSNTTTYSICTFDENKLYNEMIRNGENLPYNVTYVKNSSGELCKYSNGEYMFAHFEKKYDIPIETRSAENNIESIPSDTNGTKSNKPSVSAIIFIILGVFVGILFIIVGLSTINLADISRFENGLLNYNLGHLTEVEFGADVYTYSYDGIVEIERDLCYLGKAIVKLIKAVGTVISGIGVIITLKSLFKASEIRLHR